MRSYSEDLNWCIWGPLLYLGILWLLVFNVHTSCVIWGPWVSAIWVCVLISFSVQLFGDVCYNCSHVIEGDGKICSLLVLGCCPCFICWCSCWSPTVARQQCLFSHLASFEFGYKSEFKQSISFLLLGAFTFAVVSALNKAWCVNCFSCSTCNVKLTLK